MEKKKKPRRQFNASTVTTLILWLQTNATKLRGQSIESIKAQFDKEHDCDIAVHTLRQSATQLGIIKQRVRKEYNSNKPYKTLARSVLYLMDEIEAKIGLQPGELGQENGIRKTLEAIVNN